MTNRVDWGNEGDVELGGFGIQGSTRPTERAPLVAGQDAADAPAPAQQGWFRGAWNSVKNTATMVYRAATKVTNFAWKYGTAAIDGYLWLGFFLFPARFFYNLLITDPTVLLPSLSVWTPGTWACFIFSVVAIPANVMLTRYDSRKSSLLQKLAAWKERLQVNLTQVKDYRIHLGDLILSQIVLIQHHHGQQLALQRISQVLDVARRGNQSVRHLIAEIQIDYRESKGSGTKFVFSMLTRASFDFGMNAGRFVFFTLSTNAIFFGIPPELDSIKHTTMVIAGLAGSYGFYASCKARIVARRSYSELSTKAGALAMDIDTDVVDCEEVFRGVFGIERNVMLVEVLQGAANSSYDETQEVQTFLAEANNQMEVISRIQLPSYYGGTGGGVSTTVMMQSLDTGAQRPAGRQVEPVIDATRTHIADLRREFVFTLTDQLGQIGSVGRSQNFGGQAGEVPTEVPDFALGEDSAELPSVVIPGEEEEESRRSMYQGGINPYGGTNWE